MRALNLKEPALCLRTLIYIDRISWPKLSPFVLETVLWISLVLIGNTFQKEKEGIWIQSPVFESWISYIVVGWPLSDCSALSLHSFIYKITTTTSTNGFLGLPFFKIRRIKSLSHSQTHALLLALFHSSLYLFCHTLAKHGELVNLLVSKPHNKMVNTKSSYTHWL